MVVKTKMKIMTEAKYSDADDDSDKMTSASQLKTKTRSPRLNARTSKPNKP